MPLQYKRKYELLVGDESTGVRITDLRISFEVSKDLTGYPNLAKINIYNLKQETRARIEKEFDRIILNAGYENNIKLLFNGEIRNVTHLKQGVDTVTTIFAHDGAKDFDSSKINATFREGTSVSQLVKSVISTFKETSVGELSGLNNLGDKLQGITLSGSSKDVLDQLAEENNFEWSITDGIINVVKKDEALNRIANITSASGMIGSPTITEIGADVKILLNPELIPNGKINIVSLTSKVSLGNLLFRDIKKTIGEGVYKIQKITHIGDTHTNEWSSDIVGIII